MSSSGSRLPMPMRKPMAVPRRPGSGLRKPGTGASIAVSRGATAPGSKGEDQGYLYVAGVRDPSKRLREYETEEDVCPVCQTDRQFNKNLRLLVSPCYHKMCQSCINRLFALGPEPCPHPQCGKILRTANFAHQTFEDLRVEKEISVRRRMADIYNKRREDFETLREYNDYLQQVEELTFNLLNDTDVAETEAKLAAYQDTNASLIATNKQKTATENMSQTERNEAERQARAERVRMIEDAEKFEKAEEVRIKKDITEAIDRGNKDAITEIQAKAAKAKADRAAALAASVPPSLAALLAPAATEEMHPPTSPAYAGPYVAIPYDDPDTAPERGWYTLKNDYADGRSGVVWAKEDREGRVRGGGWDINLFWEMEVRSSVEALSLEPLR